jgi:hypothetical protein
VKTVAIIGAGVAEKMLALLEGGASPGWFAEMWVDVVKYAI